MPVSLKAAMSERNAASGQKRTLATSAYDRLRHDILHGVLRPGERLRLHPLAETYEFGIGTLREALARLVGDHMVVLEDQRGFSVAAVSPEHLADLLETRLILEERGIRRSIERGGVEWEAAVRAAFRHLLKAHERSGGDPRVIDDGWERNHAAFHRALVSGCQSPLLLQFRETVHAQGDRYRHLYLQFAVAGRDHLGEHRRIMEAALARDADAAVGLVREHLRRTVEELLARGFLQGSRDDADAASADAERAAAASERENGREHGGKDGSDAESV